MSTAACFRANTFSTINPRLCHVLHALAIVLHTTTHPLNMCQYAAHPQQQCSHSRACAVYILLLECCALQLANALNCISVGVISFLTEMGERRSAIENRLARGATWFEAVSPALTASMRYVHTSIASYKSKSILCAHGVLHRVSRHNKPAGHT